MLAMQYSIELPVGYDPRLIRERVESRKSLFDGLPGLAHKSYLFGEADQVYAPFYIWSDVAEARKFLFHELFQGVIDSFHRPRVRSWMVLDSAYGNRSFEPNFALREREPIAPEENLEALFRRERAAQGEALAEPNLHFHAIALDAERWELVRYSLWRDAASARRPEADCVQEYEVLHFQGEAEPKPARAGLRG